MYCNLLNSNSILGGINIRMIACGDSKRYLITGAAGFIGYSLSKNLLEQGVEIVGVDNINAYYDQRLKYDRLDYLTSFNNFHFTKADISDKDIVMKLFEEYRPTIVINLAAQAGVRYSIQNPDAYIQSNIVGFFNVLEACKFNQIEHLIYASSSSVYGANKKVPFEELDNVDKPVSLYAATKKSNELLAYTYSHLFQIPATGLRFFTVYGPFGRPDMAYFDFTNRYFRGEPIKVFNNGDSEHDIYRDFTYIDDITEAIVKLIPLQPEKDENGTPHVIYNIGNNRPESLTKFISTLEKCLSKALNREILFDKIYEPIKAGDVPVTYASTKLLEEKIGFKPKTSIEEGLQRFVDWYISYYNVK